MELLLELELSLKTTSCSDCQRTVDHRSTWTRQTEPDHHSKAPQVVVHEVLTVLVRHHHLVYGPLQVVVHEVLMVFRWHRSNQWPPFWW